MCKFFFLTYFQRYNYSFKKNGHLIGVKFKTSLSSYKWAVLIRTFNFDFFKRKKKFN